MSNQFDPIPETCKEALEKWDAGESVFTVEMGGLGPGYEMAIQKLAFEMIREIIDLRMLHCGVALTDIQTEELNAILDAVVHRLSGEPWAGFSGAQVGAAKSLACRVVMVGYRKAMRDPTVADRLIQCEKDFPPQRNRAKETHA